MQYVDDLLLASASAYETHIDVLLQALAVKAHLTSLKRAQLYQNEVQYLGHTLSGSTRFLTPSSVKAPLIFPPTPVVPAREDSEGGEGECGGGLSHGGSRGLPPRCLLPDEDLLGAGATQTARFPQTERETGTRDE